MKTNRLWALILVLAFGIYQLPAQNYNELRLGYGGPSGTEVGITVASALGTALGAGIALTIGDVVSVIINGEPMDVTVEDIETDNRSFGTFTLAYNRHLSQRFSLGMQANYNPFTIDNVVTYSEGDPTTISNRYDFFSLYGRVDFRYVAQPKFELYSGIMLGGITNLSNPDRKISLAPHINLLGFRVGQRHAFFGEFGLGLGPILSGGYAVKF
jgi:hypothetical protein